MPKLAQENYRKNVKLSYGNFLIKPIEKYVKLQILVPSSYLTKPQPDSRSSKKKKSEQRMPLIGSRISRQTGMQ